MNDQLIAALRATLSPNATERCAAEAALLDAGSREGFCIALVHISLHQNGVIDVGTRQLAAVVLRRTIQERWASEEAVAPGGNSLTSISDVEKAEIRALLPSGLSDPDSKIQMAIGMVIAEIGRHDYPDKWPELLPGLVQAVHANESALLVAGAIKCLGMLAEDLSETQVVSTSGTVLPQLLSLMTTAVTDTSPEVVSLKRRALLIFKAMLDSFEVLYYQEPSVQNIISEIMPSWMGALASILKRPISSDDAGDVALKFDALSCLCRISRSFVRESLGRMPETLNATWQLFVDLLPVYHANVVLGDGSAEVREEEPGLDTVELSDLVSELFEYILTLVGSRRCSGMIKPAFEQLAYLSIGYIQATNSDIERWSNDINSYLGDESEFWCPRASGELLLDEVASSKQGLEAISNALDKRLGDVQTSRSRHDPEWWRLREAVLLGLGYVADQVMERHRTHAAVPPLLQPERIASMILQEDIKADVPSSVAGRALWTLARYAEALSPAARAAALAQVAPAFSPENSALVQAGACQALAQLCKGARAEDIRSVSSHAFVGLCHLLEGADEEGLHLVLETLTVLTKADAAGAAQASSQMVSMAFKVWMDNVIDPLIGQDAEELLRAMADTPSCLSTLHAQCLPSLCEVVGAPGQHPTILVSGCLDLLTTLLTPSASDSARAIEQMSAISAISLLASSDDEEVVASATALVRTMLQVSGAGALEWFGSSHDTQDGLMTVLHSIQQILTNSSLNDRARRNVGGLILELLRHAASITLPHLPAILASLVPSLHRAEDPATVQSFLQVLATLAQQDVSHLVEWLASIPIKDDSNEGQVSALHVAMEKWTERQIEVRTPYDIRLTIVALASILACPHQAIDSVFVKGKRIDDQSGIRTRSRAAKHAEQWSRVPLRVKIVMLLADAYIEARTQQHGAQGQEEDEWIEDDGDDDAEVSSSDSGCDAEDLRGAIRTLDLPLYADDDEDMELLALANLNPLEARRRCSDPLSSLDVAEYITDVFKKLAEAAPGILQEASQQLTPTQVQAVQRIWQV